jgi:hypothetical protein
MPEVFYELFWINAFRFSLLLILAREISFIYIIKRKILRAELLNNAPFSAINKFAGWR